MEPGCGTRPAATGCDIRPLVRARSTSVSMFVTANGLGAPVVSALVRGFRNRQSRGKTNRETYFGGGMRQAGIIPPEPLHAIPSHRDHRLHFRSRISLSNSPRRFAHVSALSIRGGRVDTNIVILEGRPDVGESRGTAERLLRRSRLFFDSVSRAIRFVTHMDVTPETNRTAPAHPSRGDGRGGSYR